MTSSIETITNQVKDLFNSTEMFEAGLNNKGAYVEDNVVHYTYPAPVSSGNACGTITVNSASEIIDDLAQKTYSTFEDFKAYFEDFMDF